MTLRKHLQLFAYSFLTWFTFFLIGLPDYYQRWPFALKVVTVIAVTAVYFPLTRRTLLKFWNNNLHMKNACWLAFYLTMPFFVYDYLLIGVYWEYGLKFVCPFWYLSIFHLSFWVQFPFIGWRLAKEDK